MDPAVLMRIHIEKMRINHQIWWYHVIFDDILEKTNIITRCHLAISIESHGFTDIRTVTTFKYVEGGPDRGLMIVGLPDPLMRRSPDPLIRWSTDSLIRWSADPLIRWSADPLIRWSADLMMAGQQDDHEWDRDAPEVYSMRYQLNPVRIFKCSYRMFAITSLSPFMKCWCLQVYKSPGYPCLHHINSLFHSAGIKSAWNLGSTNTHWSTRLLPNEQTSETLV